jgi:hypothetical protein
MHPSFARLVSVVAVASAVVEGRALAQVLPSDPIALAGGRVTIGSDISATYGSSDPGFFDYTDYEHSMFRMLRINVAATVRANEHFTLLGDLQTENFGEVRPYALYLRIRPWTTRALDIQVGRVPPTFGAFSRRTYVSDNVLIGYPLGYQYLTTLRPDALPASADELLQKRSLGWLLRYSVGSDGPDHGVPLVNALRWDTGVQVHAGLLSDDRLTGTVSVTAGTIANPRVSDDNGGKQVAARIAARPVAGLLAGVSFARGAFVSDAAARGAAARTAVIAGDLTQTAWGADVEYSRDYYLLRAEAIVSRWRLPIIAQPAIGDPLQSTSVSIEGKYKITPGLYAAARVGRLGFSDITGTTTTEPWDSPVTRVEIGAGFSLQRNLLLKASFQRNRRDGGRLVQGSDMAATQLVFWF